MQRQIVRSDFDLALLAIVNLILHRLLSRMGHWILIGCNQVGSDIGQPGRMLLGLSVDTVEKHGLQSGGDRAAGTVANAAVIKLANRRNFGCGTGKKRFVSALHFVAGDTFLDHRNSNFRCQLYDGCTRDAFQTGSHVRRIEFAVLDDEYIFARSFRHIAVHIQQQGFMIAVMGNLLMGQD